MKYLKRFNENTDVLSFTNKEKEKIGELVKNFQNCYIDINQRNITINGTNKVFTGNKIRRGGESDFNEMKIEIERSINNDGDILYKAHSNFNPVYFKDVSPNFSSLDFSDFLKKLKLFLGGRGKLAKELEYTDYDTWKSKIDEENKNKKNPLLSNLSPMVYMVYSSLIWRLKESEIGSEEQKNIFNKIKKFIIKNESSFKSYDLSWLEKVLSIKDKSEYEDILQKEYSKAFFKSKDVNKQDDDDDDDDIQKLKRATAEREQDYSSMTSNEIYELIDDALDKRDFDRVKFLSKYLKESSNFEIMRYLKLFKNF
jgi:hypothetical protein